MTNEVTRERELAFIRYVPGAECTISFCCVS